ncbi:MAG: hypothetical protein IH998_16920, partial [Proteobacteria bacterium]|nr:hypothetical protein [Pseudomonadota bacterium]
MDLAGEIERLHADEAPDQRFLADALDAGRDGRAEHLDAVLARLANTVVALESDAGLAEDAVKSLGEIDADNVAVITGALEDGYPEQAPYDVIVLGGAVDEVPPAITDQL